MSESPSHQLFPMTTQGKQVVCREENTATTVSKKPNYCPVCGEEIEGLEVEGSEEEDDES